jgi:hypothetical protein
MEDTPGLIGLSQLSGSNDLHYRRHLDSWYVKNWSLLLDLAIMFTTMLVVFSGQRVEKRPIRPSRTYLRLWQRKDLPLVARQRIAQEQTDELRYPLSGIHLMRQLT